MDKAFMFDIGLLCLFVVLCLYQEYVGANNARDEEDDDFLVESMFDNEPSVYQLADFGPSQRITVGTDE